MSLGCTAELNSAVPAFHAVIVNSALEKEQLFSSHTLASTSQGRHQRKASEDFNPKILFHVFKNVLDLLMLIKRINVHACEVKT